MILPDVVGSSFLSSDVCGFATLSLIAPNCILGLFIMLVEEKPFAKKQTKTNPKLVDLAPPSRYISKKRI